jgi:hypothetical protein
MTKESMNIEQESGEPRLPYHAPRLVSLGTVQSLVSFSSGVGSDAGVPNDCAFPF